MTEPPHTAEKGLPEFGGSLGTSTPADSPKPSAENDVTCSYTTSAADYCHKHGGHLADADGRCDAI